MIAFLICLKAIACGSAFRLRGSALWDQWTGTGTTGGRLIWAGTVTLCLFVAGAKLWALAALPIMFLCAVPGWPASIDLGRNEGTWLRDFLIMTARGSLFTLPSGALLVWMVGPQFLPFAASGVLAGVCYEIGWRIPVRFEHLRQGPPLGEFIFGALIGGSIGFAGFQL